MAQIITTAGRGAHTLPTAEVTALTALPAGTDRTPQEAAPTNPTAETTTTETTTTETITVEEITMAVITAVRAHIQTAGTRMKHMPVKNIRRKSTETASRRTGRNTMTSMVKEIIPAKRH